MGKVSMKVGGVKTLLKSIVNLIQEKMQKRAAYTKTKARLQNCDPKGPGTSDFLKSCKRNRLHDASILRHVGSKRTKK